MTNMEGSTGFGRETGGDNPAEFSTRSETLAEAAINIVLPRGQFVGRDFRVSGTATIRMRVVEFIKFGGQGHTTTFDEFVTTGFSVNVTVNGDEHHAQVSADGNLMRWTQQIKNAEPGEPGEPEILEIIVRLEGTVTERHSETKGGHTTSRSDTRVVRRSDARDVTLDTTGPELVVHEVDPAKIPMGPPYAVTIEGTAEDPAGIQSVQWQHGGSTGKADSAGEAEWRAVVTLADRRTEQEVLVSARDRVGNATEENALVPPDVTPPKIARTQPPFNPHRVLWRDGGTTVEVEGMAVDRPAPGQDSGQGTPESRIATVLWQLSTGDEGQAEQTSANWATWRVVVPITEGPGVYTLETWAVDMADNESERRPLRIHAQVDEQDD